MNVTSPEIFNLSSATTYNVDFANMTKTLIISGSNTSVNVVGTSGSANEYTMIDIIYLGSITGGGTLQIFGINIPSQLLAVNFKATALYYSSSWTLISIGSIGTAFVNNANIVGGAAISFDKLATVTANRAIESTAGGELTASSTTTADLAKLSAISVSAADLNRVGGTTALTADLDILTGADAAGLTPTELQRLIGVTSNIQTQLNAKANTADFSGILEIKQFSVTIPSAQVLTLNSAPVTLVPAQGAGLKIKPLAIWGQMTYNTTPYDTNGILQIFAGGTADIATANANAFLFGTTSREVNISGLNASLVTETQYIGNAPLTVTVDSSDPLNGDSDITISGLYIVTT